MGARAWWEWRKGIWHGFDSSEPGMRSYCGDFEATGYTVTPGMSLHDTCKVCLHAWEEKHPEARPCPSGVHVAVMACRCEVPQ